MAKEFFTLKGHSYPLTTGKKGEAISAAAKYIKGRTLAEVYGHYSGHKEAAYNQCLQECQDVNGENFRITSANSNFFTVAYEVTDDTTGAIITIIETGRSTYYVYY